MCSASTTGCTLRPIKVQYPLAGRDEHHPCAAGRRLPAGEGERRARADSFPHAVARLQSDRRSGYWRKLFQEAHTVVQEFQAGQCPAERYDDMLRRVRWAMRVHRSGIAPLAERFLTLEDFLVVRDRMIGIGSVGGKTLGMLVARAILRERDPELAARLEAHRFVFRGRRGWFITFLVQNGVWWLREQQKHPATFLAGRGRGAPPDSFRAVPGWHSRAIPGHARLLRRVALHRAVELHPRGRPRQRLLRQIREACSW